MYREIKIFTELEGMTKEAKNHEIAALEQFINHDLRKDMLNLSDLSLPENRVNLTTIEQELFHKANEVTVKERGFKDLIKIDENGKIKEGDALVKEKGFSFLLLNPRYSFLRDTLAKGKFKNFRNDEFIHHFSTDSLKYKGPHAHQLNTILMEYDTEKNRKARVWGVIKEQYSREAWLAEIRALLFIEHLNNQFRSQQNRNYDLIPSLKLIFAGRLSGDADYYEYRYKDEKKRKQKEGEQKGYYDKNFGFQKLRRDGPYVICTEFESQAPAFTSDIPDDIKRLKEQGSEVDLREQIKYTAIALAKMHSHYLYHGNAEFRNILKRKLSTAEEAELNAEQAPLHQVLFIDWENAVIGEKGTSEHVLRYRDLMSLYNSWMSTLGENSFLTPKDKDREGIMEFDEHIKMNQVDNLVVWYVTSALTDPNVSKKTIEKVISRMDSEQGFRWRWQQRSKDFEHMV